MPLQPIVLLTFLFSLLPMALADSVNIQKSSSIALRGTPAYASDFQHWNYVNPQAPKAGLITYGSIGSFDNFNRFAQRGSTPSGISGLFDSLMVGNDDEASVLYGLIAESIEYPEDYQWVRYHLNPKATFQDGKAITAEDIVFSFDLFMKDGVPFFKQYFEGVSAKAIDAKTVQFDFTQPSRVTLFNTATLTILPKHFYADKSFAEPFSEPPLGSGQFEVDEYKMGQSITYKHTDNYWAANHPTKVGLNNFLQYRYDYYLDETVMFEAFKKGDIDFRSENVSKNWAVNYTGEQFDKNWVIKSEIPHQIPQGNQAFIFNVQQPQFQQQAVRQAIALMFNFAWSNENLFYGAYSRNYSNFINTDYAATATPTGLEKQLLEKYKDDLPEALFTEAFQLDNGNIDGNMRSQMRQALALFKQAGYTVKDKKMVDSNNQPFTFELLLRSATMERVALPFKENLQKIGVTMNIRLLSDSAQYINRLRDRKFDMIVSNVGGGVYPNSNLKKEWHSEFLDSTYNVVGTTDPLIDFLIDGIVDNQNNDEQLMAYGKALDRVILWRYYTIPQWHSSNFRVAYWDKFSFPTTTPKYALGQDSWWFDADKAASLTKQRAL